jgi:molybdopterin biosynthesis enzyme
VLAVTNPVLQPYTVNTLSARQVASGSAQFHRDFGAQMATISQSLAMLTYDQARQAVIDEVSKKKGPRATAPVHIWDAAGYVLAQEIKAEREYPPFDRATRDGYAVRALDAHTGATLRCAGEIKAGDNATTPLGRWTCVQIMTGAGVPPGADAVVMVEHTARKGDNVNFDRTANQGQNIVPKGSEARRGQVVSATLKWLWPPRSAPLNSSVP